MVMRVPATPDPTLIEVPELVQTPRLVIAMPRAGDGQALNAAVCESLDDLKPWMPWAQVAPTSEQSEGVARRMQARFMLREDLAYYLFERLGDSSGASGGGKGRLLGGVGLHRFDWVLRRFEIGYWLRSSAQGRGLAVEAVNAISELAFTRFRARRVEIRMDQDNQRSRAVAERCGFELEGVLRCDTLGVDALPCDTRVYSKIRRA
ncbi:MAG: GNAT family N-acetyltransferase [Burkholderiaceae bacterium]|nr:GNAT family N-acetyltransferase [Roseateles sp.]MBV8468851.1 GNAT family N-acetyltransferase [Burkholderiaceae bacterium]